MQEPEPVTLYHSTPYPIAILVSGLALSIDAFTQVYPFIHTFPPGDWRKLSEEHNGDFVFATSSPLLSLAYAFKMEGEFDIRMIHCGVLEADILCDDPVLLVVVGQAQAFRNAAGYELPTRFTLLDPAPFSRVIFPNGQQTNEWISREPVAQDKLASERIPFEALNGKAEFFDCTPLGRQVHSSHPEVFAATPTLHLLQQGLIIPANERLGLKPVLPGEVRRPMVPRGPML